jgi:RNA-splicing ligase RtcB
VSWRGQESVALDLLAPWDQHRSTGAGDVDGGGLAGGGQGSLDVAAEETFGSACHGAGRLMSRQKAIRQSQRRNLIRELAEAGVTIRAHDRRTIGEEMPEAYKDVSQVVEACVVAGIARKVALLKPMGCVKG